MQTHQSTREYRCGKPTICKSWSYGSHVVSDYFMYACPTYICIHWKVDHVGTPIAGWSALTNPTKMDDLGVPSVEESSISTVCT